MEAQYVPDQAAGIPRSDWSPHWRWLRARMLVDEQLPLRRAIDDEDIGYARAFIRDCRSKGRHSIYCRRTWPVLTAALAVYEQGGRLRSLLEAGLLTEAETQPIADLVGLHEQTVACFSRIFFDVRSVGYGLLSAHIVRPAMNAAVSRGDDGAVLKLVGFFLGWNGLVTFLKAGALPDEFRHELENVIRCELTKQALGGALLSRFRLQSPGEALDRYLEMTQADRSSNSQTDRQAYEESVATAVIHSNCFYKLSSVESPDLSAHEPRAIDMIRERQPPDKATDERKADGREPGEAGKADG